MAEDKGINAFPHWDKGDPIKADQLNKLSGAISNQNFYFEPPLYFRQTQGNVTVFLRNGNSGSSSSAYPFKGYNTSVGVTGTFAVNDNDGFAGTIKGITPTLNGVTIGTTPTPTGSVTGNGVVYVNCVISGSTISGTPTIEMAASMPAQTTGNAYVNLFSITGYAATPTVSYTIAQNTINSLWFQNCGSDNLFFGA